MRNIEELKGKVISSVVRGDDYLLFNCSSGETYKMYHQQDCYESVTLEDIDGDIDDLIDSPILLSEEVYSMPLSDEDKEREKEDNERGSSTWTFYKLATIKGYVNIRWYGSSNGYYSEGVDLILLGVDYEY